MIVNFTLLTRRAAGGRDRVNFRECLFPSRTRCAEIYFERFEEAKCNPGLSLPLRPLR
jgi:hypothetical protein